MLIIHWRLEAEMRDRDGDVRIEEGRLCVLLEVEGDMCVCKKNAK